MFTITSYERSQRQPILDLIFRSTRVFTHLDWHDISQWLETPDAVIRLAWREGELVGVMAAAPPLNETTWLRIAVLGDFIDTVGVFRLLWEATCQQLKQQDVKSVSVLVVEDWILKYLPPFGFAYTEDIITLSRANDTLLPPRKSPAVTVRTATITDISHIVEVDQTAFVAPWQMSLSEISQAKRISAACTVAALPDASIVAYQLSTLYNQNGHLARLAVLPHLQGQGLASLLLEDLIVRFRKRNVHTLTVNTQGSNVRSQQLYARYGFHRNGYDLPVWTAMIKDIS